MKNIALLLFVSASVCICPAAVEPQPFLASLRPLMDAAEYVGSPFSGEETATLRGAMEAQDAVAVERAQGVLDRHALFIVTITPEQRVKVAQGAARPELSEAGWRQFLLKVVNESGATAPLRIASGEAKQVFDGGAVR